VRLLTTEDPDEAREIAAQLSQLNEERRAIEAEVQEAAEAQLGQHNRAVQVLAGHGWHPGVIGIVAGRIKEKTGKPAIVIALDATRRQGKGSGRSISGVDLGAAIIAAREAGLLVAGGGHAMAAGLTIERASWKPLPTGSTNGWPAMSVARAGTQACCSILPLRRRADAGTGRNAGGAGPFGMGWPGPRIAVGPVRMVKADIVGKDHLR
jgi:single-stranded-DNA-specific exonuclease